MNIITLSGRLVRDPEVKPYGDEGKTYTRFTIAVDRPYHKGKERQADFINCTAFGKTGEVVGNWFNKGNRILLDGSLRISSYEKDGKRYTSSTVIVNHIEFVDRAEKRQENQQSPMQSFGEEVGYDTEIPF